MIQGAPNRVPFASHWNLYREAEPQHPTLIAKLVAVICNYIAPRLQVNGTTAGAELLADWDRREEWNWHFGDRGSELLGMVLWVTLFDDTATWQVVETVPRGRSLTYRRI